jgi:DNA polymerase-3 subunit epsilon
VLPLLLADDQETAEHERLLVNIDKASKGKTVWRIVETDFSTIALEK